MDFLLKKIIDPLTHNKDYIAGMGPSTCVLVLKYFKYTFDSTCVLLKYFLIPTGVLVLYILKYQMRVRTLILVQI